MSIGPGWVIRHVDKTVVKLLDAEKETGQVIEDRCRETNRIDSIQHSCVPHHQGTVIVDPSVPLDRAHGDPPCKTEDRYDDRHECRLPRSEGGNPVEERAEDPRR